MSEIREAVKRTGKDYEKALESLRGFRKVLTDRRETEFTGAGGCGRCYGRGWVVTWDTMDSMSGCYAEYGQCPDFSSNPGAHGPDAPFNHARFSKYDKNRGVKVELAATESEAETLAELRGALDDARLASERAHEAATVRKGRFVRIVRGRKVPKGTEGFIFWAGPDKWSDGIRIGLKDEAGEVFWTAGKNAEVIAL